MPGNTDFNENPVVSLDLDLDLDLGFVKRLQQAPACSGNFPENPIFFEMVLFFEYQFWTLGGWSIWF